MPENEEKNWWEKRREELGLTRTQLAARLNVTEAAVRCWETDSSNPRPTIADLASAYETTEKVIERELIALRRRMERRGSMATSA